MAAPLFERIRQHRVVPLLGAYLAAMWLLTELLDFAVSRFALPGRWVDALFLSIWLLLPGALLVIWRVGPDGPAHWRRRDALLLSLNAMLVVVMLAVWSPRAAEPPVDAGPASVPSALPMQFPASVFLMVRTADDAGRVDAMSLTGLTTIDIEHDPRLRLRSLMNSPLMAAAVRRHGGAPLQAPQAEIRAAALQERADGMVIAELHNRAGQRELRVELTQLKPERSLPPLRLAVGDRWDAAEQLAAAIRQHFAPSGLAAYANDPPIKAISTDSAQALEHYAQSIVALAIDGDPARAEQEVTRAWETDPQFAHAGLLLLTSQWQQGLQQEAARTQQRLLNSMRRLSDPERYRLQLGNEQRPEGKRAIYEAWIRKRPSDVEPLLGLAWFDLSESPDDEVALERIALLLQQSDSPQGLMQLANAYRRLDRQKQALAILQDAVQRFPGDSTALSGLGAALAERGDFAGARAAFEQMALMQPDQTLPLFHLAQLHFNQGQYALMFELLARAETSAQDDLTRLRVLNERRRMLVALGRSGEAVLVAEEISANYARTFGAMRAFYDVEMETATLRTEVEGDDLAIEQLPAKLPDAADPRIAAYGQAMVRLITAERRQDAQGLLSAAKDVRAALSAWGADGHPSSLSRVRLAELTAQSLDGRVEQAMREMKILDTERREAVRRGRDSAPGSNDYYVPIARIAVRAGDIEQAQQWLQPYLTAEAGNPMVQLANAELLRARGDVAAAKTALDQALKAWSEADASFAPAQHARELKAQLTPNAMSTKP